MPMICLDGGLRHFAAAFRGCFSQPQPQYFMTVWLALMLCREHFTLSGLLQQVSSDSRWSGTSGFLSMARCSATMRWRLL
ncbi:MAG: hypothetical protein L0332_31120 [Chloroflexi bacterium]|nr:hypothetical protein [Chloroflexota bacterium]